MSSTPDLNALKLLLATHQAAPRHGRRPASLYPRGVPVGALAEITGSARTSWILSVLQEHASTRVLWLEEDLRLFPPHLAQAGIDLNRIAFIECREDSFGVLRRALRSQVFEFIVTNALFKDERILRALRLLCEKARTTAFFVAREPSAHRAISLQLEARWTELDGTAAIAVRTLRDKAGEALPTPTAPREEPNPSPSLEWIAGA